ncbi:MAG: hypothetical protein R3C11_21780 [Planctomycetaceae bacterium]
MVAFNRMRRQFPMMEVPPQLEPDADGSESPENITNQKSGY